MNFSMLDFVKIILIFSLFSALNITEVHAKVRSKISFKKDRSVSALNQHKKKPHAHRKRPTLERTVPEINILR